jgi:hypothetical protein
VTAYGHLLLCRHSGQWKKLVSTALRTPSLSTPVELGVGLNGKRNYVMLARLLGCALRRNELAELEIETIHATGGEMVLNDLEGQGPAHL